MDRVVSEPEPRDGAGRKVLHQHIGRVDQAPERFLAQVRLEIERERALVAVDRQKVGRLAIDEGWPPGARVVSACRASRP